jgi:hypothetical protein
MFTNYTVGVWNKGASTKVNGITIPGVLTFVRDIDVDMQPYSTALLLKTYGYNIECTKRFFIDDIVDIKIGTILKYGTEQHEVKKIIEWDYFEVMTLEVQ